jgi:hypothetical protein
MKKLLIAFLLSVLPFSVHAADFYVATNGTGQGTSWADATNNLQGAISGCASGETCWVSNGTYVGNFTVGAGVTVRSIDNNPASVLLDGNAAGRVMTMTASSWVIGCTVTNGYLVPFGFGGVGCYKGSVSNCIIRGNRLMYGDGAAVALCMVFNSILENNSATKGTSGATASTLYSCVIRGNTSTSGGGGGADNCTLFNCLFDNNAADQAGAAMYYCVAYNCTIVNSVGAAAIYQTTIYNSISWSNAIPDIFSGDFLNIASCGIGYTGTGSITNDPLFVSTNDFHLESSSSCINTGTNGAWTTNTTDLDGNPRIWPRGETVDMGAYEYGSQPSYPAAGTIITIHGSGLNLYGQGTSVRGTAQ